VNKEKKSLPRALPLRLDRDSQCMVGNQHDFTLIHSCPVMKTCTNGISVTFIPHIEGRQRRVEAEERERTRGKASHRRGEKQLSGNGSLASSVPSTTQLQAVADARSRIPSNWQTDPVSVSSLWKFILSAKRVKFHQGIGRLAVLSLNLVQQPKDWL